MSSAIKEVRNAQDGAVKAKTRQHIVVGLFVAKHILQGDRIIGENALCTFPPGVITKREVHTVFSNLKLEEQYQIENLTAPKIYGQDPLVSIFLAHSFMTEDGTRLFSLSAAYIRHSCCPNAIADWNADTKSVTVHALRSLEPTEELRISYINTGLPFWRRWELLRLEFGIDCTCIRCSPLAHNGDKIAKKDRRIWELEEILDLYEKRPNAWTMRYQGTTPMEFVRELMRLQKDIGAAVPMDLTYRRASVFSTHEGNFKNAKMYSDQEVQNCMDCWGGDSPRTAEAILWRGHLNILESH